MTQPKLKNNSAVNRNEDDIPISYQNYRPPPPPGREDLWELQFCRWWGWNWVKKREEQKAIGHQRPMEPVKPQRKHLRDLCNCLCFKKKEKINPNIQKMYNTPSNSVILCETYTCGVLEKKNDSISHLEIQRNISQKGRRQVCDAKCNTQSVAKLSDETNESSVCGNGCRCCQPSIDRSSTEESIEYLNIQCCPCCHPAEVPAQKKCNCETQTSKHDMKVCNTQTCQQKNICATQTTKKHKIKRICLICCHCKQVCCCNKEERNAGPAKIVKPLEISCCVNGCGKVNETDISTTNQQNKTCICQKNLNDRTNGSNMNDKPGKKEENNKTSKDIDDINEISTKPMLKSAYIKEIAYPVSTQFYNKHFTKFGMPSQNYPWLQSTKSDIFDKIYSMKLDEEFSSPLSGKTYNLTPVKVDNVDLKTVTIPDPIGIHEEVNHLRKLESELKMDLESRVMLDAVCDAILSSNPDISSSSTFLNEYTYGNENNLEIENILDNIHKKYDANTINNLNNYFTVLKNPCSSSNYENKCLHLTEKDVLLPKHLIKSKRSDDFSKILQQQKFKKETTNVVNIMPTPSNLTQDLPDLKEMLQEIKIKRCFEATDTDINYMEPTLIPKILHASLTDMDIPNRKRSVSSILAEQANKRAKEKTKDSQGIIDCVVNISDIFNKIDEIVVKSKENDKEIRNVLNNMPQNAYQFFSPGDNENVSDQLDVLLENTLLKTPKKSKEKLEVGKIINYNKEDSKTKLDGYSKTVITKKKKRSNKSLIPLRKNAKVKQLRRNNCN